MNVPFTVDLTREVDAKPDTVWRLVTTPERFSAWMNGEVSFEPVAGSPFRAAFPNFETVVAGEIRSIDHEVRRLEVTWGVESGPQAPDFPAGSSLVTIEVTPDRTGSRVRLTHAHLPSTSEASDHEGGWRFHLSRLALITNREDLEAGLTRTLPHWFAAWNEPDDERRLAALRACCSTDVEFRDDWTEMTGVELLSEHIGNCFRYMPGFELRPTGDVRVCRGEALIGWTTTGPQGEEAGFNHTCLAVDGTLRRVTGFSGSPPSTPDA